MSKTPLESKECTGSAYSKPMRGCRIYASDSNMTKPAGSFVGWCEKVDGDICIFSQPGTPEMDRFVWRFREGINNWFVYSA